MKYVIITPTKNEEKYIEYTLRSVCAQTLKPKEWIIVNDGSADRTAEIVEKYIESNSWIKLINNNTVNEKRSVGSKVVRAFYVGYDSLKNHDYDFIVKLDADLTLPKNYFEVVSEEFYSNKKLGICGGIIFYYNKNNRMIKEKVALYHVRGALKAYRKKCFEDIEGLKPVLGWDGIDEMTAMMKGWEIRILPLEVIHHRLTGKEGGLLKTRIKNGKGFYIIGYHPFFLLLRTIYKVLEQPYVIGSILTLLSFIKCYFDKNINHIDNKELIKFIRKKQIKRLLFKNTKR